MKYGKLIRDKIPEEIKQNGNTAITHQAEDEEYFQSLINKVKEEVNELAVASNYRKSDEMADILEVIYALRDYLKLDSEEIERLRVGKFEKKGGFTKRLILDEVN
jgi:predicted house-cleaning noncanonical NTP pyrophosphatase (MazG superfamily)